MTLATRFASTLALVATLGSLTACDLLIPPAPTLGAECVVIFEHVPSEVESPTERDLNAIDGSVIVGDQGTLLTVGDEGWVEVETPTDADLFGVASGSSDPRFDDADLVVVGAGGTILYSEELGHAWTETTSPSTADLRAVVQTEQTWVAVGDEVALFSSDGIDWYEAELPRRAHLRAVEAYGNELWAAGDRGTLLVSDDAGQSWQDVSSPTSADLFAMTAYDDRLVIVGAQGTALVVEGSQPVSVLESVGEQDLLGVGHYNATGVYGPITVGTDGLIHQLEREDEPSTESTIAPTPGGATLRDFTESQSKAIAVGDGGTILELSSSTDGRCSA